MALELFSRWVDGVGVGGSNNIQPIASINLHITLEPGHFSDVINTNLLI